jgi:DNA-binding transcriptional LysR family regulator
MGHVGTVRLFHVGHLFDFVTALVSALHSQHPDLTLHYMERPTAAVAPAVLEGEASVGLTWGELAPGLSSSRIDMLALDTVFVPEGHRLAGRDAIEVADLDGETFIHAGVDPVELWRDSGVDISVRQSPVSGRDELATRVETGEGIVLTSSRAVPRYQHRALVAVPLADQTQWGRLEQLLIWRTDDDSPAVRRVVETAEHLDYPGAVAL